MKIYFLFIVFFIYSSTWANLIQMKDYLCGCDYCNTVTPHEPLDIAGHMMRCHSQREGMLKTLELMREQKKPEVAIKPRSPSVVSAEPKPPIPHGDKYRWEELPLHGWVYTTPEPLSNHIDAWLYLDRLGWVWTFGKEKKFIYHEDHRWLYLRKFQGHRLVYWYDRRIWVLLKNFDKSF